MPRLAVLVLMGSILIPSLVHAENWPEFRGPTGQGHYDGKNLPVEWSTTKNVAWKQVLPGKGWSTPIVQDGRIYLTGAVPVEQSKVLSLQALCLDAAGGRCSGRKRCFARTSCRTFIPRTAMPVRLR